jgi:hypothetical protein
MNVLTEQVNVSVEIHKIRIIIRIIIITIISEHQMNPSLFIPQISEYRKNTQNFGELRNNHNMSYPELSATRLENINN